MSFGKKVIGKILGDKHSKNSKFKDLTPNVRCEICGKRMKPEHDEFIGDTHVCTHCYNKKTRLYKNE